MFNLLQSASDDQSAIGACLLMLGAASVLVFMSFHMGPAGQRVRNRRTKSILNAMESSKRIESEVSQERAA